MAEAFSSQHTQSFPDFLTQTGVSLLVSTYQAGKLITLRHQDGVLNTHFIDMQKPMGIALQEPHLAIGSAFQLGHYFNMPDVGAKVEPQNTHNACYVPRETHITGDIDIHEMGFTDEGELWLVNTKMSCLCTISQEYSVVPKWRPPFISAYDLTDRCHLNGLAMKDGKPAYVSALGTTDVAAGWRENKASGGMLMDIRSNKMIASGLSMPHSPRWYQDQLYVLESGAGSLATVDIETGKLTTIVELPGFTRGLDFIGRYAIIGLSQVRETAVFAGLPLTERCKERQCGVYIVDIVDKQVVGFVVFSGEVQEIFSVQLLPSNFPAVLSLDDPLLRSTYSIPDEALKEVAAPDPEQLKLEQANALYSRGKIDDAIAAYQSYLNDFPDKTQARLNLGAVLLDSMQWQKAIDNFQFVIDKEPNHADAHNALGRALTGLNQWKKAKASYDQAIAVDQQYAAAYYNRALVLLSEGKYQEAWKDYEWRWKIPGNQPLSCAQPEWKADKPLSELEDKVVLVHTEQGNKDSIQFARFIPSLSKHCKKVIVLCQEPLRLFFKGVEGVDEVRLSGHFKNEVFDVFIPLMSLPGILNSSLDSIPSDILYWTIPTEVAVPDLSDKLNENKKVGLIWKPDPPFPLNMPVKAEDLLPLIEHSNNTNFYSLQLALSDEESAFLNDSGITNLEQEMVSYAHLGKLIDQLDAVISVDNSVAHLAASLGKPTILILDQSPGWMWQGAQARTWYPSIKIVHNNKDENWQETIQQYLSVLNETIN